MPAQGGYDWIDDAFDDSKADPPGRKAANGAASYDWIDDAFDDSKADPLAAKGMTGCSGTAVLLLSIGVIAAVAFMAFVGFNLYALAGAPR